MEKKSGSGIRAKWDVVAVDSDWETSFYWRAGPEDPIDLGLSAISYATVSWTVRDGTPAGTYRLCYFGNNKNRDESIGEFSGCSSEFAVVV